MTLLAALCSRNPGEFADYVEGARDRLGEIFPPDDWGIDLTTVQYTTENYANLWTNELRASVRQALEAAGKSKDDFAEWLGQVHYTSAAIYPRRLFADAYQSNAGWRILAMGIPAVGVLAVGLASHYQNAQNHKRLAAASNLLFDHAQQLLTAAERSPLPGRKVTSDDWDRAGLLDHTMSKIAGVDIGEGGIELGDVRTTTVKKIIASLISVATVACAASDSEAQLEEVLGQLRSAGAYLVGLEVAT